MTVQSIAGSEADSVRKIVNVRAPVDVAWRVFTEKMATWWPLAMYKIGKAKAVDAVIEPRVEGRWYERGEDGSTCDWGRVVTWEPHARVVLTWEISPDWQHDPALKTELDVRFTPEGKDATRVEFEHRRFSLYGSRHHEMRAILDSDRGWQALLNAFAATAAGG